MKNLLIRLLVLALLASGTFNLLAYSRTDDQLERMNGYFYGQVYRVASFDENGTLTIELREVGSPYEILPPHHIYIANVDLVEDVTYD